MYVTCVSLFSVVYEEFIFSCPSIRILLCIVLYVVAKTNQLLSFPIVNDELQVSISMCELLGSSFEEERE